MKITLYTDGGTKGGNPGEGYGSCCIIDSINRDGVYVRKDDYGQSTSNEAEYRALIIGLKAVKDRHGFNIDLEIKTDSALLVGQLRLSQPWRVKAINLRPFVESAKNSLNRFTSWKMIKVPREEIVRVLGH